MLQFLVVAIVDDIRVLVLSVFVWDSTEILASIVSSGLFGTAGVDKTPICGEGGVDDHVTAEDDLSGRGAED